MRRIFNALNLRARLILLAVLPLAVSFGLMAWMAFQGARETLALLNFTHSLDQPGSMVEEAAMSADLAVRNRVFLASVGMLGLTALFAVLATRRPARRMAELTEAARRIAEGNLETPVPQSAADEIGELAGALEVMRQNLRASLEQEARRAAEAQTARVQSALLQLSQALLGETDAQAIAGIATRVAAETLAADFAAVTVVEPDEQHVSLIANAGWPEEVVRRVQHVRLEETPGLHHGVPSVVFHGILRIQHMRA